MARLINADNLKERILAFAAACKTTFLSIEAIIDRIDTETTADAKEVVHGQWIAGEDGLDEDGNGQYRCSNCGVGEKHNPTVTVSHCWNCGAKMDGERRTDDWQ